MSLLEGNELDERIAKIGKHGELVPHCQGCVDQFCLAMGLVDEIAQEWDGWTLVAGTEQGLTKDEIVEIYDKIGSACLKLLQAAVGGR